MEIDDSKSGPSKLGPVVKRPLARDPASERSSGRPPQAANTAGPAVSVSLGSGANLAVAASAAGVSQAGELSDVKLLDTIRDRINKGEFDVNFDKLALLVLGEAMAAAGRTKR